MSNLITFYDTETTGKWDFKLPWNDPSQPNLVQLGFQVYDLNRMVVYELGVLVNTTTYDGWEMQEGAQAVHGISKESVELYGFKPEMIAKAFLTWVGRSQLVVAHNDSFDLMVIQNFLAKAGFNPQWGPESGKRFCTMRHTTNICKIPSPNGRGYKWPKLIEAYQSLVDQRGFKGAHNALVDVNACADIFWKLADKELLPGDLIDVAA